MCELALPANFFIEREVRKITQYGLSYNNLHAQNFSYGSIATWPSRHPVKPCALWSGSGEHDRLREAPGPRQDFEPSDKLKLATGFLAHWLRRGTAPGTRAQSFLRWHFNHGRDPQLITTRSVEGRIGEQTKAVDFNQRGGTADQGDTKGIHGGAHCSVVCPGRVTR
jgi:hypothetical protein